MWGERRRFVLRRERDKQMLKLIGRISREQEREEMTKGCSAWDDSSRWDPSIGSGLALGGRETCFCLKEPEANLGFSFSQEGTHATQEAGMRFSESLLAITCSSSHTGYGWKFLSSTTPTTHMHIHAHMCTAHTHTCTCTQIHTY